MNNHFAATVRNVFKWFLKAIWAIVCFFAKNIHEDFGNVGCGVCLLVVVVIGAAIMEDSHETVNRPVSRGRGDPPAPPPVREAPVPKPPTPEWHGATNMAEVVHRILARLEGELAAMGIDGSNVVANAKAYPQHLFQSVPEHEKWHPRPRLLVLSDEDEAKIARKYVEECRAKGLLADNDAAGLERVSRIVARLVPIIPQIAGEPEVHLLRDDSVNACCLPDGTVFVNTGTLRAIQDDDLLAAILAHELGHAAARHGNEGISRALKTAAAGVAFEEGVADLVPMLDSGEGVSLVRIVYGLGSAAAYTRPRDRRMEAEADRLGTRYLARAGFDPESMLQFFEWLKTVSPEEKTGLAVIFRTHPFHSERADHVREVLQEADLREMPKEGWGAKLKRKADEIDFSKTHAAISNWTSRLPGGRDKTSPSPDATNAPPSFPKMPKLPWGRKGGEKVEDIEAEK